MVQMTQNLQPEAEAQQAGLYSQGLLIDFEIKSVNM